jgi:hypothetical protein
LENGESAYREDHARLRWDLDAARAHLDRILQILESVPRDERMAHSVRDAEDARERLLVARERILGATEELPAVVSRYAEKPAGAVTSANGLMLEATGSLSTAEADVLAVQATIAADAVDGDPVDEADDVAGGASGKGSGVLNTVNTLFNAIKAIFSKLANRLVSMLSKLVKPKEWKIAGEVTGGVPALALGKVTLEITFGP